MGGILAKIGEAIVAPVSKSLKYCFVEIMEASRRLVDVVDDIPQLIARRQDQDFYYVLLAVGRAIDREQFSLQKTRGEDGKVRKELVFWGVKEEIRIDVSGSLL